MWKGMMVALALLALCGCSIRHDVVKDYPQYLSNNVGESQLPSTSSAETYSLSPATIAHHYEFRAGTTGYANLWMVDFGKMLDDTMQSTDVQKAFNGIRKSNAKDDGLIFTLDSYTFSGFGAHVSMHVAYFRDGSRVFNKRYRADGVSQGGKMFWGGAFAMKNAIQQSSKNAIDQILTDLIDDLNDASDSSSTRSAAWH